MIHYGRKSWVPDSCPTCGSELFDPDKCKSISEYLKDSYLCWRKIYKKHEFWKMKRWFGGCGNCFLTETVNRENPLLKMMGKITEGKYIPIPLTYGKDSE